MSTYLFTELEITNPAGFQLYREAVGHGIPPNTGRSCQTALRTRPVGSLSSKVSARP